MLNHKQIFYISRHGFLLILKSLTNQIDKTRHACLSLILIINIIFDISFDIMLKFDYEDRFKN